MKKKIGIILLSIMLLLPVLSITAFAASYNTTFEFSASVEGPFRNFSSANNISISTAASAPTSGAAFNTFSVSLIRNTWYGYTTIGSASHPRNGSKTSTWSNVGSGEYKIFLSKATDTITVKGTASIFD